MEAVDSADDISPRGDRRLDVEAGDRPDVIDGEDVGRVGHRDEKLPVVIADGQRRVTPADRFGYPRDRRAVDRELGEVDESKADLGRKGRDELALRQHPLFDQHATEASAASLMLLKRGRQLWSADETVLEQDVSELLHPIAPPGVTAATGAAAVLVPKPSCRPPR